MPVQYMSGPRAHIAAYHGDGGQGGYCDAAKRMADVMTLHAVAGNAGRWCLIRLIDGSSDDTVYDSRDDVEHHKTHPAQIAVQVIPGGVPASEAEEVLHYHREVYDKLGKRPLEVHGLVMPLTRRDQRRQIRALKGNR